MIIAATPLQNARMIDTKRARTNVASSRASGAGTNWRN
jgi:hypothetical protein